MRLITKIKALSLIMATSTIFTSYIIVMQVFITAAFNKEREVTIYMNIYNEYYIELALFLGVLPLVVYLAWKNIIIVGDIIRKMRKEEVKDDY